MASANLSAYNAALKQTWTQNRLEEQLFQGDDLLSRIEKTTRFQVGRQAVTPLHVSRNGGYTALGAGGGSLNAAGNQGVKQATWNYTNHHQQIAIEGEAIDGTASDALTVANAIDTEVSGAVTDLRRQLVRQIALNGDSIIAACGTTTASNVVVLNAIDGQNAVERGWLFVGAVVDIGTAAAPTAVAAGVTVTAVDETAFTITVSGAAVTTGAANQVSYKGSRVAGPASYEMNGLTSIVNTTSTLGGITVASEPQWKAPLADSTSQALTLALVYALGRKVKQKTGEQGDWLVASYKQGEQLYKLLQAQVRYAGDNNLNTGSVDKVQVGDMSVDTEFDIKNEHMFALSMKHLFILATDKPYWANKISGGEILAWIQGTDSYGSKLTYRIQLATNRRNVHAAYTGLT